AVFAFAVRGALLLVTRLQQLGADEGPTPELVRRGAREQLLPILAATLASAAMLLPFAVGGDIPGLEIVHPMAIVMLGGLVASTLLILFVVPALYLRFATAPEPPEDLLHRWGGVLRDSGPADDAPWLVVSPDVVHEPVRRRRFARGAPAANGGEPGADATGDGDDAPPTPTAPPAQAG
ncbi:MAG: hypothetical protein QOG42_1691, partial [Solirubrobacteraceae bacterium]|nr:hypothetical protein [Solirubrobacteraceae bacterium]